MKLIKKAGALIIIFLITTNCSTLNFKNMPTISSLRSMKMSNDSLYMDFKLDIPNKTLNKKLIYEFIPTLIINESDTLALKTKKIYGEKIDKKPQVSYKYGGEFSHSDTIVTSFNIHSIRIIHNSKLTAYGKEIIIKLPDNLIFKGMINYNE